MVLPMSPTEGLGVLHLFCKVPPSAEADAVLVAERALGAGGHEMRPGAHQLVCAALLGHKADLCLLALGPDLWRLRSFQTDIEAAGLEVVDSYLSLTELSEYAAGLPEERKQARLYPQLPPEGKPAFCFYPMSKRRSSGLRGAGFGDAEGDNWYRLPYEEREQLMYAHGATGRTFAGRVLQLVTGSTGIDDYEWGVTLFAVHPDDLKECVYTMRYDEASALYAEFGTFYTGMVAPLREALYTVGVRS
jgi:peroxiredoxin